MCCLPSCLPALTWLEVVKFPFQSFLSSLSPSLQMWMLLQLEVQALNSFLAFAALELKLVYTEGASIICQALSDAKAWVEWSEWVMEWWISVLVVVVVVESLYNYISGLTWPALARIGGGQARILPIHLAFTWPTLASPRTLTNPWTWP